MDINQSYEIINIDSWKRKLHYSLFKDALIPYYNVCVELDITSFLKKVKASNWSFTLAFIHTVTSVASQIENYRYRFVDNDVVLYKQINTSFTYLNKETELFKVINVPYHEDITQFLAEGKTIIEAQEQYLTGPIANDVFQFSSLPWVSFTQFTHTLADKSKKSNPMFDWGKYTEKNGKMVIPFAIQVHHSFVDGFHVGQLVERLQERLNTFY